MRRRSAAPRHGRELRRSRPRNGDSAGDLTDEELRALADADVDPDEALRVANTADDDLQEASDHDRDTPRDRIEGLLLEQDGET